MFKGSWEIKIQNRLKKLQRKKSVNDTSNESNLLPKKLNMSCWTVVPTETETEENITALVECMEGKTTGKIQEMIRRTYAKRRELTIVHVKSIIEIIAMFPPMQNMLYVSTV